MVFEGRILYPNGYGLSYELVLPQSSVLYPDFYPFFFVQFFTFCVCFFVVVVVLLSCFTFFLFYFSIPLGDVHHSTYMCAVYGTGRVCMLSIECGLRRGCLFSTFANISLTGEWTDGWMDGWNRNLFFPRPPLPLPLPPLPPYHRRRRATPFQKRKKVYWQKRVGNVVGVLWWCAYSCCLGLGLGMV